MFSDSEVTTVILIQGVCPMQVWIQWPTRIADLIDKTAYTDWENGIGRLII